MFKLIELLGWVTAISFVLAVSNYFVKLVHKKYISKLPKEKENIVKLYRMIMKIIVKYHKLFGTVAVISAITHGIIAYNNIGIKIMGSVSALIMFIIGSFGVYGAYFNKTKNRGWLKIHRLLALSILVTIAIHISIKI